MDNIRDVEMLTLRRSPRIAEKQRQQLVENLSAFNTFAKKEKSSQKIPKARTPRKKENDVAKMNVDVQIKKKTRKTKTNKKNNKKIIDKFVNLEKTKLNDIFPLIKKYSLTEGEKNEKYVIVQTIIKNRKALNINTLLTEIYIHKNNIILYLYKELQQSEYSFPLDVVSNHLNDILSYREIDDLDDVINDKQSAENKMKKDLQEIEKLNAMVCRLMM